MEESDDSNDDLTDLEREVGRNDVALEPGLGSDPVHVVEQCIPKDILLKYEVHSYRNAALILSGSRETEFSELLEALRAFSITTRMIREPGGNQSEIPKVFCARCTGKKR